MAGTVGTERGVACAARVFCIVAVRTGWTQRLIMHADPVRVEMGLGLGSAADLNAGDEVIGIGGHRDRMTHITLQAYCLIFSI